MMNALLQDPATMPDDMDLFYEYKKTGSAKIRDILMEKYIHIPHSIAKRYSLKGIEYDDLYQSACIGLLHALNNFDPERNFKFPTYASICALGEVKHLFREHGNYIKVPRKIYDLYYRAKKMTEDVIKKTGSAPSVEEIALEFNALPEEVECAINWGNNRLSKSLEQFLHEGEDMVYSDVLGLEDNSLLLLEDKMFLENCFSRLTEQEKTFLKHRYYDEMSQADIAKKMKLSQMKVSRMEKKILTFLKDMYKREY